MARSRVYIDQVILCVPRWAFVFASSFLQRTGEMFAGRSAMLIVAVCLLASAPVHGGRPVESSSMRTDAVSAYQLESSTGWLLARAPRSTTLAQFTPWRARPKILLGETDHNLLVESDLGPVLVPSRLITAMPTLLASPRLPMAPPLRC